MPFTQILTFIQSLTTRIVCWQFGGCVRLFNGAVYPDYDVDRYSHSQAATLCLIPVGEVVGVRGVVISIRDV